SVKQNRPINQDHIHKLKEIFKKSRLERHTPEHRIITLYSADKVRYIQAAIKR
ncbi:hypothetical protein LZ31DRAFT_484755, partial [Colletotrichum somersetense]